MERILISWIAVNNDFVKSEAGKSTTVNSEGPTMMLHRHWFPRQEYTRHILLSSEKEEGLMGTLLHHEIHKSFKGHPVQVEYLAIADPIDLREIHQKVQGLLQRHPKVHWDFFISPGTSMMQISWFLLHQEGIWKSRLLNSRKPKDSKHKEQEFFWVELDLLPKTTLLEVMNRTDAGTALDNLNAGHVYTGRVLEPLYSEAQRIARFGKNKPILILGETGTGKEQLARYIHNASARKNQEPFVAVNCASIPDDMLYAELFGYVKGAFTGATQDFKGYFEQASGGTLFLDEIGDISPRMQVALLRVIQEQKIRPLGKGKEETVSIRLITATHRNLELEIEQGRFREDLYFRISRSELHLPALRNWPDDEKIKITDYILEDICQEYELPEKPELSTQARKLLNEYTFPGNIRELHHVLERAVIQGQRIILPDMFPSRILKALIQSEKSDKLETIILNHVKTVYEKHHQDKAITQKRLGLGSRNTLIKYLKRLGIEN